MKKFSRQILIIAALGLIIFLMIFSQNQYPISREGGEREERKNNVPEIIQNESPDQSPVLEKEATPAEKHLPENFLIKNVAFISQAPAKIWDDLHKEACEEATLLIVKNYLDGKRGDEIDVNSGDEEIKKMVKWQTKIWGGHFDLSLEKVKQMAETIYGIKSEIKEIKSLDEIKKIISEGKLVIAPTAGRELRNPYFQNPGPVYHMVVIFGYDKNNFIVHDVGTRRGANYKYPQKTLFDAIYDLAKEIMAKEELLANPALMFSGKKSILVF